MSGRRVTGVWVDELKAIPAEALKTIRAASPSPADYTWMESRVADWQPHTVVVEKTSKPPAPRWATQHKLLRDAMAHGWAEQKRRETGVVWSERTAPWRVSEDRVALMRSYVAFLADHNRDMAMNIQAEITAMSTATNRFGRKRHREAAWKLCVADATLRLPESST